MNLTDFEKRLFTKYDFDKREQKFIENYSSDADLKKIIKKLKRLNSAEVNEAKRKMYENRMKKDSKYRFETQCKCVVGGEVIATVFHNKIKGITSYEQVLKDSKENTLSKEMQDIMDCIKGYLSELV